MEIDPDRVPLFKLILHLVQISVAFVVWVLEITVFTGKDAKVVGNNGWTFGVVSTTSFWSGLGQVHYADSLFFFLSASSLFLLGFIFS